MSIDAELSTIDTAMQSIRDKHQSLLIAAELARSQNIKLADELEQVKAELDALRQRYPEPSKFTAPANLRIVSTSINGFVVECDEVPGAPEYNWDIRTKNHTLTWYVRTSGPRLTWTDGDEMPNWELWVSVRAGLDGATQSDPTPELYMQLPTADKPSAPIVIVTPDTYTNETFTEMVDLEGEKARGKRFEACTFDGRLMAGRAWPHNNGLYIRRGERLVIYNCLFRNIPHQGIEAYGMLDCIIRQCAFVDCWEPIHVYGGMVNFEISDCDIRRATRIGIELQRDGDDIRVLRNRVQDHARVYADSFGLSIATVEARNVMIHDNFVWANMPNNPHAPDSLAWNRPDILTNPGRYGMGIEAAGGKDGGVLSVLNNTIRGRWVTPISVLLSRADIRGNHICGQSTIWPGASNGVTGDNSGLAANPRAVRAEWNSDFATANTVRAACSA